MVAANGRVLFELAFAGDRKCLILNAHVDVLQIDVRQIGLQNQFVFRLIDIDGRRPGPIGLRLGEHTGEGVFEAAEARRKIRKWIVMG